MSNAASLERWQELMPTTCRNRIGQFKIDRIILDRGPSPRSVDPRVFPVGRPSAACVSIRTLARGAGRRAHASESPSARSRSPWRAAEQAAGPRRRGKPLPPPEVVGEGPLEPRSAARNEVSPEAAAVPIWSSSPRSREVPGRGLLELRQLIDQGGQLGPRDISISTVTIRWPSSLLGDPASADRGGLPAARSEGPGRAMPWRPRPDGGRPAPARPDRGSGPGCSRRRRASTVRLGRRQGRDRSGMLDPVVDQGPEPVGQMLLAVAGATTVSGSIGRDEPIRLVERPVRVLGQGPPLLSVSRACSSRDSDAGAIDGDGRDRDAGLPRDRSASDPRTARPRGRDRARRRGGSTSFVASSPARPVGQSTCSPDGSPGAAGKARAMPSRTTSSSTLPSPLCSPRRSGWSEARKPEAVVKGATRRARKP